MPARKNAARKAPKKPRKTRKPSSVRPSSRRRTAFLDELQPVGTALKTASGSDAEEFFFLYVPRQ